SVQAPSPLFPPYRTHQTIVYIRAQNGRPKRLPHAIATCDFPKIKNKSLQVSSHNPLVALCVLGKSAWGLTQSPLHDSPIDVLKLLQLVIQSNVGRDQSL